MYCTEKNVTQEVAKYVDILEGEEFRIVKDFPNYYVSNMARVFSKNRKKLLNIQNSGWGYCHVTLSKGHGEIYHKRLHRLVIAAFVPNNKNYPDVHHKDGNRKNNILSNLEWISTKRNTEIGKGIPLCLIDIGTGKQTKYATITGVRKRLHTSYNNVIGCINGEIDNIDGYKIKYA